MNKILDFSIAERININIYSKTNNQQLSNFLNTIYLKFDKAITNPKFELNIYIGIEAPKKNELYKLGLDAIIYEKGLKISSGHVFFRENNVLNVYVPKKVKRGRIPFKRKTPGRHITDEVIEPLLLLILLENNLTFLHASCIVNNNKAEVIMGWRHSGKTFSLLKKFDEYEIWSDDFTIVSKDGFVYPYPKPIRLYSYNLEILKKSKSLNLNTLKLKIKNIFTPSWKPVYYLQLNIKQKKKKIKIKNITFLNNKDVHFSKTCENIINFEESFFYNTKILLEQANIFKNNISVHDITDQLVEFYE